MTRFPCFAPAEHWLSRVSVLIFLVSWPDAALLQAQSTPSPASERAPGVYQCALTVIQTRTAPDGTVEQSPAEHYVEHVKITDQYEIAKWNAPRHEWGVICAIGDSSCVRTRTPRYVVATWTSGNVMATTIAYDSEQFVYEEEFNFVTKQGSSFNTRQTGRCIPFLDPALGPRPKTSTSAGRYETCVESCEYESQTCRLRTRNCEIATLGALVYGLVDDKDMRNAANSGREKCLEGLRDDCDAELRTCRSSCQR